tara:strand:+ start:15035 stop:15520 length:486 start_codon:yes stop_codon:yes gene_type:complete
MPYLLILIGLLFLLYVAFKYLQQADAARRSKLGRYVLALLLGGLSLFVLLRGNIPVAIVLATGAVLAWQGVLGKYLAARAGVGGKDGSGPKTEPKKSYMSQEEALEILGLQPNPTAAEIKEAYHRLMLKIHPDQGGSDYLASKINQAKDVLLQEHNRRNRG